MALSTSGKVIVRLAVQAKHAKARRLVVVLVDVPEDVHLLKSSTCNGAPVSLSIGHTGHTSTILSATDGPAGLGHPDPFARANSIYRLTGADDAVPEGGACGFDRGALEVWVAWLDVSACL